MAVNPLVQRALGSRMSQPMPTGSLVQSEALAGAERSAAQAFNALSQGQSVVDTRPQLLGGLGVTGPSRAAAQGALGAMRRLLPSMLSGIGSGAGAAKAAPSASASVGLLKGSAGDPKSVVRAAAAQRGWTDAEWAALDRLVTKESGWRPNVKNPTSSAWGLFQFLDMHKKPGGYLPHGNNSTLQQQADAGLRYIAERYGSPSKALQFHLRNNWY